MGGNCNISSGIRTADTPASHAVRPDMMHLHVKKQQFKGLLKHLRSLDGAAPFNYGASTYNTASNKGGGRAEVAGASVYCTLVLHTIHLPSIPNFSILLFSPFIFPGRKPRTLPSPIIISGDYLNILLFCCSGFLSPIRHPTVGGG
jgi:hypothetical protein